MTSEHASLVRYVLSPDGISYITRIDLRSLPGIGNEPGKSGLRIKSIKRGGTSESDSVVDYLVRMMRASFRKRPPDKCCRNMVSMTHWKRGIYKHLWVSRFTVVLTGLDRY